MRIILFFEPTCFVWPQIFDKIAHSLLLALMASVAFRVSWNSHVVQGMCLSLPLHGGFGPDDINLQTCSYLKVKRQHLQTGMHMTKCAIMHLCIFS